MGTRTRKKQPRNGRPKTQGESGQHGLVQWQTLLGAGVAAVAAIVVALLASVNGGSTGPANTTPSTSPSGVTEPLNSRPVAAAPVSIAISGVKEQTHPPPPGRKYIWSGEVNNEPKGSSIYVIDKRSGDWLVSPPAVISASGDWTVTWIIATPPASADWIAVVYSAPLVPVPCPTGVTCPPPSPAPGGPAGHGTSEEPSDIPGVVATATYHAQV
jgi:hypothetical protein